VHDAIEAALVGTPGVLADPPPFVQTRAFADSGVEYAVYFFTNDFGTREKIDGYVRDRVWYAMQRAGISIPFPIRTVHMHAVSEESVKKSEEVEIQRRDRALRCVDFLDVLPDEAHKKLAASIAVRVFAPGEVVVRQGDESNELFVIDKGEVVVELSSKSRTFPVAKLGAGKFFGEMSLMTGEPRRATVRAVTECELFVIDHDAFQEALASQPGLVERMSHLLALRQAELEAAESQRSPTLVPDPDRSKRLISQIKNFFKI
jgi:CRP-like cAMP-binding protein